MSCSNSKNYARIKEVSIATGLSRSQVSALFHQIKPAHKRGDATAREQAFETARVNLLDAARANLAEAAQQKQKPQIPVELATATAGARASEAQVHAEDGRGQVVIPAELLQKFSSVSIPGLNETEVRELATAYLTEGQKEGQPPSMSKWLWGMALERNKDSQRFLDVQQRYQYPTDHYLRRHPFQTWEEAETFSLSGLGKKGLIPGAFSFTGEHIISIQPSSSITAAAPTATTTADAATNGNVLNVDTTSIGDSNTQSSQVLVVQTMSGHDKTERLEETLFEFKTYEGRHELKQVTALYGDVLKLLLDNPGKVVVENRHDENFRWLSLVDAQTGEFSICQAGSQGERGLKLSAQEQHYIRERLGLFPSAIAQADWQGWPKKKRGLRLTEPSDTDLPWNCSKCGEPRGSNPAGCDLCESAQEETVASASDASTAANSKTATFLFDAYGRRREQTYYRHGSRSSPRLVIPFQNPAGYNSLDYNQFVASSTRFVTVRRVEQDYFSAVAREIKREVKQLQRTQSDYLVTDGEMLRLLKDNPIELDLRVYDQYRPLQMLPLTSVDEGVSGSPYALPITDEDIISLAADYGCRRTRTPLISTTSQPELGSGRESAGTNLDASTSNSKPKELGLKVNQIEMGIGIGKSIPVQVSWHPLQGVNIKPLPTPPTPAKTALATNGNGNGNDKAQVQSQEPMSDSGVWLDWDTWDYLIEGSHECRVWKKALVAGANGYQAVDRIETETETISSPTPSLDRSSRTDTREAADNDLPF